MRTEAWSRRVAEVARALQAETGASDTMDLAARLAVDTIDGAEMASLSVVHRGHIVETPAATSEDAFAADALQYDLGSGPLIVDVWEREVVSWPDLSSEPPWQPWAQAVGQKFGFRSVLSFRMFAADQRLGAISLYSTHPHGFSSADIEAGISFAAHTAIAIEVARDDENKELALDSRSIIGQATGIVMERYGLDAVRSFAALKRISQESNVPMHQVAADLIRTRILIGGPDGA